MNKLAMSPYIGLALLVQCACAAPGTPQPAPTPTDTPAPTATPAPTQNASHGEYKQVFEVVWSTINQTYFDPNFGGLDWDAVHARYEPLVAAAQDDGTLYQLLNQMLWELKVSHAGVFPEGMWSSIEPATFAEGEIGIDVRLLEDQVVITRLDAGSPADEAGLRPGFIIRSINGATVEQIIGDELQNLAPPYTDQGRKELLTRRLLSLIYGSPGTCVTLTYLDENDRPHEECIEHVRRPRPAYMTGIRMPPFYLEFSSTRLTGGIGYIRFNTFHPDLMPDMVEAVAALQDAPGIIIDLRGNPGGNPETAEQLAAQFLDGQVLFGNFGTRAGTLARMVTGKHVYTGPLVVLIDASSYSGSEHFASGMQAVGRATIIGERSPGGATAANVAILPNDAVLVYPVAQLLTPDGTAVEGRGVIPDITVTLERGRLLAGVDAQLQAAIDHLREGAD